ncbi:small ubiquitin-related modifier 2-A-like [Cricetulus griseus]|uniref:Small ubiquitin-related modifier 2-A-like n=1 Tax=Cricetulus griseus TaxID=10029 RepID=A0A9J7F029_CRIGR|nr:small ubiquitin-related modifier 2-A-like [Cricetulus griseus]XP_027244019.1 small ubiquitin-related modifier 2-A-like [Cricetulus griseus]
MALEEPKEGVETENNDHIDLKVVGRWLSLQFKMKRQTALSELMKAYCEQQLEKDEEMIDVFQQQTAD